MSGIGEIKVNSGHLIATISRVYDVSEVVAKECLDILEGFTDGLKTNDFSMLIWTLSTIYRLKLEDDWTKCSDDMPKKVGYYLVTIKGDPDNIVSIRFLFHDPQTNKLSFDYNKNHTEVIAWKPMPVAYKEGKVL